MTKDPDTDYEARKLDLQVDESNLGVHEDQFMRGEQHLAYAETALLQVPGPSDTVSRLIYAQAHAAAAAACFARVDAGLYLQHQRRIVDHERAHVDHFDEQQERAEAAKQTIVERLQQMTDGFEGSGIHVHRIPMPGGGFAIGFGVDSEGEQPEA